MGAFLQVIGGVFIFLVFIAVGLYLWFKWNQVGKYLSVKENPTPSQIHLIPDVSPDWIEEKDAADKAISEFESLGFTAVGPFKIKEMPPVRLFSFVHTQAQMMAVVYNHEAAGVWCDVCTEYENGKTFTVTNAPMGQEIDVNPNAFKIWDKTLNEFELIQKMDQERGSGPYKSVSAETFAREFERSYAEDMDWRNRHGGPTKEEILQVAKNMNIQFNEDMIDSAYTESVQKTIDRLNEECIEQFIATTTISVAEWEDIRDHILTIHEKIPPQMLLEYFDNYVGFSEEHLDEMESLVDANMSVDELFRRINESLPDELKSRKVGEVSTPVRGEIYAIPEASE